MRSFVIGFKLSWYLFPMVQLIKAQHLVNCCQHVALWKHFIQSPAHWLFMDYSRDLSRYSLHWRHNGCDNVSNHQPHHCLLNHLFRHRSKKASKLCVTGLCVGNSPGTGEFPAHMASNAENVSIWWRHHETSACKHALGGIPYKPLYINTFVHLKAICAPVRT